MVTVPEIEKYCGRQVKIWANLGWDSLKKFNLVKLPELNFKLTKKVSPSQAFLDDFGYFCL